MATPLPPRVSRYPAGLRSARHAHPYANVSVILAGSLRERVGREEVTVGPLSVVVKPAGTEHANRFGAAGATLLRVEVPCALLDDLDDGSRAISGWRWVESPALVRWLLRLTVRAPTGSAPSADDAAEALAAIPDEVPANDAPPPAWLTRVRERICDERGRGARVHQLAAEAAVHPVYLARQFRRHYGTSLTAFRHAQRVRRASALLVADDASLSGIAYDTGFADQPHLTRVFGRLLGVTPARYRALVRGEVANVQSPAGRAR
jgi:AraC family transcriptional regulator